MSWQTEIERERLIKMLKQWNYGGNDE